jgi:hypothetical protein
MDYTGTTETYAYLQINMNTKFCVIRFLFKINHVLRIAVFFNAGYFPQAALLPQ